MPRIARCAISAVALLAAAVAQGFAAPAPATQPDPKIVESWPDPVTRLVRLGKYDEAVKLGEQSIKQKNAKAPDQAQAVAALAEVYITLARYSDAKTLLAGADNPLAAADHDTALALASVYLAQGDLAYETGDFNNAVTLASRALDLRKKNLAADDLLIADATEDLTMANLQNENTAGADAQLARVYRIRRDKTGEESLPTADAYSALGFYYLNVAMDVRQARLAYQKSLDIRVRLLGEKHLDVADSLFGLAELDNATNHPDDAVKKLEQARGIIGDTLSKTHPYISSFDEALATHYLEAGDAKKAATYITEAADICEKSYGPDHRFYADAIEQQAMICRQTGETAKAEELDKKVDAIRAKQKKKIEL